ncbi:hypothetical protein ASE43_19930 [Lysobacter sp. Root983]|nr:hypothetical protein ASE43_19930 [Lysobacter sp. Root983]
MLAIALLVWPAISTATIPVARYQECRIQDLVGIQPIRFPAEIAAKDVKPSKALPATFGIKFDGDGNLLELTVLQSSSDRSLDRAAMHAIRFSRLTGDCLTKSRGLIIAKYEFNARPLPSYPRILRRL